jgi:hypothetical protein
MVGARYRQELDHPISLVEATCGACAQVEESPVLIVRNLLALFDIGEAFEFELLLAYFSISLVASSRLTSVRTNFVLGDNFAHFVLDFGEVFGGKFVLKVDIVVESCSRRRTDIKLRLFEKAQHGGGQYMTGRMTDCF